MLKLRWELMADSRGPLTKQGVTIRRQLETARRPEVYATGKLPLRILLAVSRPDDSGFLDPRHTTRSVLAMSHAVHVEATKVLLARFYAELAEGATIGQALEQGRAALVDQPER